MAVAKCRACRATVTVRIVDGAVVAKGGDSFRSRCKERSAAEEREPADCSAMREAVTRAALRAEREKKRAPSAPPPAVFPA
jgi:hypothetical protein